MSETGDRAGVSETSDRAGGPSGRLRQPDYTLAVGSGGDAVAVGVTRKRVRNLNLRVRRDGTVVASVPWHTSRARAQAFLDAHEAWIRRALERRARAGNGLIASGDPGASSGDGAGGDLTGDRSAGAAGNPEAGPGSESESDPVRGGAYSLWGERRPTPTGTPLSPDELDRLYRDELSLALPEVIARMEPLVGAHASAWQLRAMTSRWGSCTPATGRIRINVRLAAYPPECLDYVVAHELTHLLEPSHNARFHALLGRVVANERELRARLRQPPA